MKINKSLLLVASLAMATNALAESKFSLSAGVATLPMEVTGYTDAVLNDYHKYPSSTGATYLNLDQGNVSGSASGYTIGLGYSLSKSGAVVLDYTSVSNGDVTGNVVAIGYKYTTFQSKKLSFSVIPKFGKATITTDLGSLVSYGTMPIITTGQTFNEGDAMEATAEGTIAAVEVEVDYSFTEKLLAFFKIGYQTSSFDKPSTTIGGNEVSDPYALDSGSLSGSTITYNPSSNINPFESVAANMDGLVISFGATYKF